MLVDTSVLVRTSCELRHPQPETVRSAIKELTEHAAANSILFLKNLVELWVVATRPINQNGLGMSPASVAPEMARLKSIFLLTA